MKKIYEIPALRYINLETEGVIAGSQDSVSFDANEADAAEMDGALSNKQNMWDREGIWK